MGIGDFFGPPKGLSAEIGESSILWVKACVLRDELQDLRKSASGMGLAVDQCLYSKGDPTSLLKSFSECTVAIVEKEDELRKAQAMAEKIEPRKVKAITPSDIKKLEEKYEALYSGKGGDTWAFALITRQRNDKEETLFLKKGDSSGPAPPLLALPGGKVTPGTVPTEALSKYIEEVPGLKVGHGSMYLEGAMKTKEGLVHYYDCWYYGDDPKGSGPLEDPPVRWLGREARKGAKLDGDLASHLGYFEKRHILRRNAVKIV